MMTNSKKNVQLFYYFAKSWVSCWVVGQFCGAQMMIDNDDNFDVNDEFDIELMPLQVAERLEGSAGCAQFPRAFRDLHSQVQIKLASNLFEGGRQICPDTTIDIKLHSRALQRCSPFPLWCSI